MAEELRRGNLQFWVHQGVMLMADDVGQVDIGDLNEFVQYAAKHFPDSKIQVHCYGLRATKVEGTVGPKLDWRDWG